jgi:hypothetical protein
LPHAEAQEASPRVSGIEASAVPPDISNTVVPITSVKIAPSVKLNTSGKPGPALGMSASFGTGFCLDPTCHFIATNYHVAVNTSTHKIKGERIQQRYVATGPQDEGATPNYIPGIGVFAYATKRDLAILELRRSLRHHHGLNFSLEELEVGQQVDIYGYPKNTINPIRTLTRFPATFKAPTTSGLLAFDYDTSDGEPIHIRGGASGGIVVDRKTQKIVAILSGTSGSMALAVPVQTLADFVRKVQPFLAQKLFPSSTEISPTSPDVYSKFAPSPDFYKQFESVHVDKLQRRPQEPYEISLLRDKAQSLAEGMRDFIALQSYAWGSGDREPNWGSTYEVRVIDGVQRFRRYPDGKAEFEEVPEPALNNWVIGSDEWSNLPKMVGTEYRLKIHQAPDVFLRGQRFKVFQYYSSVEDNVCPITFIDDFLVFSTRKTVELACFGEVWTDEGTNIVRISRHFDLSEKLKAYRGWDAFEIVVTYGWLKRPNEAERLIPQSVFTQGQHNKKTVFWCRGQFTDYRMFSAQARFLSADIESGTTGSKP